MNAGFKKGKERNSKKVAIDFADFIKDNHYTKCEKGWYKYYSNIETFPEGFTMSVPVYEFLTTEELFNLYNQQNNL